MLSRALFENTHTEKQKMDQELRVRLKHAVAEKDVAALRDYLAAADRLGIVAIDPVVAEARHIYYTLLFAAAAPPAASTTSATGPMVNYQHHRQDVLSGVSSAVADFEDVDRAANTTTSTAGAATTSNGRGGTSVGRVPTWTSGDRGAGTIGG